MGRVFAFLLVFVLAACAAPATTTMVAPTPLPVTEVPPTLTSQPPATATLPAFKGKLTFVEFFAVT